MRLLGVGLLLTFALGGRAIADDMATATVPGVTVREGDWARYAIESTENRQVRRHEELWTAVAVSAESVLFSVQSGDKTEWMVVPPAERPMSAVWVVRLVSGHHRSGGSRPPSSTPAPPVWPPQPADTDQRRYEEVARVTARKVSVKQTAKGKDFLQSVEWEATLDPTVPVLGVKRATWSADTRVPQFRTTMGRSLRLLGHGGLEEQPPPPAEVEGADAAHLRAAALSVNPFADLVVGGTATFKVVRRSCRPIGGESRHEGRIQVTVVRKTDETATLRFLVLEGAGEVTGSAEYESTVPRDDAAARAPHRHGHALLPMINGVLGGETLCRSGARRETTAQVAGASLPAEAIELTFENETRYEATFARGSPVGFVAAKERFSNGIPESWDEMELTLATD